MSAQIILEQILSLGVTVALDGGRLRLAPKEKLTDEIRAVVRDNKAGLVRLVSGATGECTGECKTCPTPCAPRTPAEQGTWTALLRSGSE